MKSRLLLPGEAPELKKRGPGDALENPRGAQDSPREARRPRGGPREDQEPPRGENLLLFIRLSRFRGSKVIVWPRFSSET